MATLYEINTEVQKALDDLLNSIDPETGEVDEAYLHAYEDLNLQKDEKLDNIGVYIKEQMAMAKAIKEEEANLKDRREKIEGKIERLKNYTADILAGEKWSNARVAFSFRKSDSVDIPDDALIPDEFIRTEVKKTPDKKAIKEALKRGQEVRGAFLIEKNNLQIK